MPRLFVSSFHFHHSIDAKVIQISLDSHISSIYDKIVSHSLVALINQKSIFIS